MSIDIKEIADKKIEEMTANKTIENLITKGIENVITSAITGSINGYKVREEIESKISKEVTKSVEYIDFTAYNSLIVEQFHSLINTVLRDDIAMKVKKLADSILLTKRDSIKLSEIIDEYKKLLKEEENLENGCFVLNWEEKNDGSFRTVIIELKTDKHCEFKQYKLEFMAYRNNPFDLNWVYLDGKKLTDFTLLHFVDDFQALIINLYLNRTPVVFDVNKGDIDTYAYQDDED